MEKLVIYPFNTDSLLLAKYQQYLDQYEIIGFIENPEKDSDVVRHQYVSLLKMDIIFGSCKNLIREANAVLLLEDDQIAVEKYQSIIDSIKEYKTKLIITKELKNKMDTARIEDICILNESMDDLGNAVCKTLTYINIPVIAIMSVGEECNKYDIQIQVRNFFIKKGYKVLQFGSKQYSKLFNIHIFPEFLYSENISFEQKILRFNHYINNLVKEGDYDLLILGVPGGILPINDRFTNHFSEIPKIISEAVQLDINIISLYYEREIDLEFLNYLSSVSRYIFKCDTNYFNVSNTQLKYSNDEGKERVDYYYLDFEHMVDSIIAPCKYNIACCFTGNNTDKFFEAILNELIENIEII